MAPHPYPTDTDTDSLISGPFHQSSSLITTASSSSSETITTIVFGLCALGIGIVTIMQGSIAWKLWRKSYEHRSRAHDRGDQVATDPDLELGDSTLATAPVAAPDQEPSLSEAPPSLTSSHASQAHAEVENPFEQTQELSVQSSSTGPATDAPLNFRTTSNNPSALGAEPRSTRVEEVAPMSSTGVRAVHQGLP